MRRNNLNHRPEKKAGKKFASMLIAMGALGMVAGTGSSALVFAQNSLHIAGQETTESGESQTEAGTAGAAETQAQEETKQQATLNAPYNNSEEKSSEAKETVAPTETQAPETTEATTEAPTEAETRSSGPYSLKTTKTADSNGELSVSDIAEDVMPAMVAINVSATETVQNPYSQFYNYFGYGNGSGNGQNDTYQYEVQGSGSGIVISYDKENLMLLTNYHVIEDAQTISVTFIDDQSYDATVKGYDADADLAVLTLPLSSVSQDTLDQIAVATLGSSDDLKLGEEAVAIGNALGYGQSVTVGYISALEREVKMTDKTMTLLQTDAAINPGNSGGALVNAKGEIIGINSAKYSNTSVEGMGYAIPISYAIPIVQELMNSQQIEKSDQAYLGITAGTVTDTYQTALGWPAGVYVSEIASGSPAETAGMSAGDIITEIDGHAVDAMEDVTNRLAQHVSGDIIDVVVQRQQTDGSYKEQTLSVTLISRQEGGLVD